MHHDASGAAITPGPVAAPTHAVDRHAAHAQTKLCTTLGFRVDVLVCASLHCSYPSQASLSLHSNLLLLNSWPMPGMWPLIDLTRLRLSLTE